MKASMKIISALRKLIAGSALPTEEVIEALKHLQAIEAILEDYEAA